uniref:Uncharacterized protein n=1 Tax=Parascaris equorum TaxID=6256 RepID=A0A914RRP9_PAREQ
MFRRLGHAYEVYPLIFLGAAWFCAFLLIVYVSVGKVEVWLDRSQEEAPWDWERIRDNYYKQHTVMFVVLTCVSESDLAYEMSEAAKRRGTR